MIFLLIILIVLSGFFSGSEVALLSVTNARVRSYLNEKRKGSAALNRLKSRPRRTIITILIGNNVVNISAASLTAVITAEYLESTSLGLTAGILTLVLLIFGEITPKTISSRYAGQISLLISRPIEILQYILFPLVLLLEHIARGMEKFIKLKKHEPITEAEIKAMIEFGVEKQVIEPEEQYIMHRVLEFSDTSAQEVMVPMKKVFSVERNLKLFDAIQQIIDSGFSRIPVYQNNKHNITGIAMAKDIARELVLEKGHKRISEIAQPPIVVNSGIKIDDLFKIFKQKHVHIAVVKNRKTKKAIGIVTLEDLLEELVGEIEDESDRSN